MPRRKLKILIVAACASELKPFVDLKQRHHYTKNDTAFLAAGIGPVAASFGLSHFLEDYKPERIFAIGTAGIINKKKFGIGEIVLVKTVATESFLGGFYTPTKQPHAIDTQLPKGWEGELLFLSGPVFRDDPSLRRGESQKNSDPERDPEAVGRTQGSPLRNVSVYSPQEITRDETHRKILEKNHDVEHLESFAFAFVAKKFKIPIQIVLGLTNFTDKNAHRDWKRNQGYVMKGLLQNIRILAVWHRKFKNGLC